MLTVALIIMGPGLMWTQTHVSVISLLPLGSELSGTDKFRSMILLLLVLLLGGVRMAVAQGLTSPPGNGSTPVLGGAGGVRPPILNGTQNAAAKKHLGPTGKPCLTVLGYAQPQTINPDIFDHMISASNDCSQPIKMQVCYYQTQQCIPVGVPAYGRKEVVLGIMPAMKQFQFEYREMFDQGMGGFGASLN
jgi:hypothetical protein